MAYVVAFTEEDRKELATIIAQALDEERERLRAQARLEASGRGTPWAGATADDRTILCLIATGPIALALPDVRGRAVFDSAIYARVKVKGDQVGWKFFGGPVEIVAYGDGKLLEKPLRAHLNGGLHMVEIEEGFLESLK